MYNYKILKSRILSPLVCFVLVFFSIVTYAQSPLKVDVKERVKTGDKITFKEWKAYDTYIIDSLTEFSPSGHHVERSKYGFFTSLKGKKTGFYHTEKIGNRWWVIDPEGNAGINIMLNSVQKGPSEKNKRAYASLYKDSFSWISATADLMFENGFNGAGSWSDINSIRKYNQTSAKPIPYTIILNWMSGYGKKRGGTYQAVGHIGYPNQCIFVFDPEFESYCMEKAKELVLYAQDANLIGYFSDNELPLSKDNLNGYLKLPQTDPGYQAAIKWLSDNGISINEITDKHKGEFAGYVAERYYSTVLKAIKTYDPNHMYLGSRLYASSPHTKSIIEACARNVDIITINYYNNWELRKAHLENWLNWSDKPFQVTEFYTKSEDTGMKNTSGAGWIVKTQKDRGYAYQHFCMSLLNATNCVGWHWFKYMDNDPEYQQAEPSNVDANKGIVDNNYIPYDDLLLLMKQLNDNYMDIINYFSSNQGAIIQAE